MAIRTGAAFRGFTFGGISSKDFGVYISGDGVFDAPEKDVEMVSVPGRNGAYALDHGRFLNISVEYPAGLFGLNEEDFADAISDLRNALASKKGYQVLEDDYHPGEFRQAIYRSGLEVTPAQLKAGEFTVVFDCKPQRWITAGQEPVSMTSGDTIENPTAFDAAPLLLVDGYGTIDLGGGGSVTIDNVPLGYTPISQRVTRAKEFDQPESSGDSIAPRVTINTAKLNQGDPFTVAADGFFYIQNGALGSNEQTLTGVHVSILDAPDAPATQNVEARIVGNEALVTWSVGNVIENYGTATAAKRGSCEVTIAGYLTADISQQFSVVVQLTWSLRYYGTDYESLAVFIDMRTGDAAGSMTAEILDIYGTSSKNATGYPLYIDLDIGEAYKEEGGEIISSNAAVTLGATLPVLPPGETEVTFPATIASLEIVPRYWKL